MEVAKVTSKGQITIPISIRRKLDINEGDKVLFIYKPDGVLMVNPVTFQGAQDDEYADEAETEIASKPVAAKKKKVKPAVKEVVEESVADEIEESTDTEAAASEPEQESRPRPVPPPVEEPEKPEKNIGGLNLSTLLDDIRSIGSNY